MRLHCRTTLLTVSLLLWLSSASEAEYLIYLKGGHFIIADDCRFSTNQIGDKGIAESTRSNEPSKSATGGATRFALDATEDCTKGEPEGRIFWSTTNGNFGEVNVDDVYAILGAKTPHVLKPSSGRMPLEDYLITNRGESFINARLVEEKSGEVHGLKRDDLNTLSPNDNTALDSPVPARFLKDLEQLKNAEAGVRLCYRKVKIAKGIDAEK